MLDFKLVEITDGTIRFTLPQQDIELVYELEYSHSEGEAHIDPTRNDYMEYFELELDSEALYDQEKYEEFMPTDRLYNAIKNAVQNYHFHIVVI